VGLAFQYFYIIYRVGWSLSLSLFVSYTRAQTQSRAVFLSLSHVLTDSDTRRIFTLLCFAHTHTHTRALSPPPPLSFIHAHSHIHAHTHFIPHSRHSLPPSLKALLTHRNSPIHPLVHSLTCPYTRMLSYGVLSSFLALVLTLILALTCVRFLRSATVSTHSPLSLS